MYLLSSGCFLLAALCQLPQVSSQSCNLRATEYEKYTASKMVSRYAPDEAFPTESDEIKDYVVSAATPPIILLLFAICLCCGLCIFNCCNCRRLNENHCCVPHERSARFEDKPLMENKCRIACWGALIFLAILLYIFNGIGFSSTAKQSNAIGDLPSALGVYADFVEDDVIGSVKCFSSLVDRIQGNATALAASTTDNDALRDLNAISGNASSITGDTFSDVEADLQEIADEITKLQNDAQKQTDNAGDLNKRFVNAVLAFIVLCASIQILTAASQGVSDKFKGWFCCQGWINQLAVLVLFIMLILAVIYNIVIRVFAGFCVDPVGTLIEAVGNNTENDARSRYYIQCAQYTATQLRVNWPWTKEQEDAADAFSQVNSTMDALRATSGVHGLDLTNLTLSINDLGESFSSDAGVFGYQGLLSCAVVDRFLQAVLIDLCTDLFNPTALLFEVLVVLAFVMCCTDIVTQCLRREPNVDRDDGDGNDRNKQSPEVGNPTFTGEDAGVSDPPPYKK
eukprot:m.272791 g.272791  ORF g.272791 m.272791 type:complete len:512 (+) comp19749_c0_seq2:182-1717(+)